MYNNTYGRCSKCTQPTSKCGCGVSTTSACSTTPKDNLQVDRHECNKVYNKTDIVSTPAGVFRSLVDNNTVEPSVGVQTNPQSWIGPLSVAELLETAVGSEGVAGVQGAAGPSGATGADGAQGAAGAAGEKGDVGLQGNIGPQGADGVVGPQGVNGPQGQQGLQGADGATGAQGNAGIAGVKGDQGVVGNVGQQGVNGAQGATGAQGGLGVNGAQGTVGPQGEQGIRGDSFEPDEVGDAVLPACPAEGTSSYLDGVNGLLYFCVDGVRQNPISFGIGPQGADGVQGLQGAQGGFGPQGVAGVAGSQGVQGTQGTSGIQGIDGNVGPQGVNGAAGQRGLQGLSGPQGLQGVSGNEGPRGTQGAAGVNGNVGPQGAAGAQGSTGVGTQGADGAVGPQGAAGAAGPQGAFGGPQGDVGATGAEGPMGVQGANGLDYDPNCVAPVVTSIECADAKGNVAFHFDDADVKFFHFKDFMPSAYSVAAKVDNGDGTFATVNPNGSVITWFAEPTNQVIITAWTANGLYDHNHQMINFTINSRNTGGCIGKGSWLLVIECDNCNCIVPEFVRNANGSVTLNDGKGLIETFWPNGYASPFVSPERPYPAADGCEIDDGETTSTAHGCIEESLLGVPKWNCETAFSIGVVEHEGHLYYNLVEGNKEEPAVGTASGSYKGGFDIGGLMDYMITKKLTDLGVITNG